jgi:holo-[acyl-carrier protein] synthase
VILGIGIDVVRIDRIRKSVEDSGKRFLEKIFTAREIAYSERRRDPSPSYAARFAAKEALIKALSADTKMSVRDIEVINDDKGKPEFNTKGRLGETLREKGVSRAHLSLTHEKDYAAACVVLEGE